MPTVGKPKWLRTTIPHGQTYFKIVENLRSRNLVTVCQEAKCPNIGQCWNTGTATFMVLGDTCTRACRFCHIKTGNPQGVVDYREPQRVADSVAVMGLDYVVITMVDRDDLSDGGAGHLVRVVDAVRKVRPQVKVELLTSDFAGVERPLQTIAECAPQVFAHNIETVERLTPRVRDARAGYRQSLAVLANFKALCPKIFTKSSLMLGLGERQDEIEQTLSDLRQHRVDLITLGQYMRPTTKHLTVKRYLPPQEFSDLQRFAESLGFQAVASGPLVRSSYRAKDFFETAVANYR